MTHIVTTHYRYKRPPRKRQAAVLEVPAVVKAAEPAKAGKRAKSATLADLAAAPSPPASREIPKIAASDDRQPVAGLPAAGKPTAIVTIRRRKHAMLAHLLEDLTPEEHRRRGDAADALFRTVVRLATGKDRPQDV
jgi:hypothetical protein